VFEPLYRLGETNRVSSNTTSYSPRHHLDHRPSPVQQISEHSPLASTPNLKGRMDPFKTNYIGLKEDPRSHQDGLHCEKRAQDNQRLKMPNPSKLTGISRKMIAPKIEESIEKVPKDMNGLGKELTSQNNQERHLESPNLAAGPQADSKGPGDRTSVEISEQLTLCNTLQPDLRQLRQVEGNFGILTHGPPCQGPRTLLTIYEEL
jgi:hypothetical protein